MIARQRQLYDKAQQLMSQVAEYRDRLNQDPNLAFWRSLAKRRGITLSNLDDLKRQLNSLAIISGSQILSKVEKN